MTKIKLNNYECEIDSYNRNTNIIEDGTINSKVEKVEEKQHE